MVMFRAGEPGQNPQGGLSGPGMANGRIRAPQAFCSFSQYSVVLCQGWVRAESTIAGPCHGVTLTNSPGLSIPDALGRDSRND